MKRQRVGIERTILCATRFWSIDHIITGRHKSSGPTRVPPSMRGVRHVVRKQGYTGPEIEQAMRKLHRDGFIDVGGRRTAKTIRLTGKGGKVKCSSVSLSPWTDSGGGAALKGCSVRRKRRK